VRAWAKKYGIKAILFDLDDTLIKVRELFYKRMDESIDFICSWYPKLDKEQLKKRQGEINTELFFQYSVDPKRWVATYKQLQAEFPGVSSEIWKEALRIVFLVYTDIPEVFEGAVEVLTLLQQAGITCVLVTHASIEWTAFKLEVTGLGVFFDHVVCISPAEFKTLEAWVSGAKAARVSVEEVAAIGDNLKGDIESARKAGIKLLFWIKNKEAWSVYLSGTVPEGTLVIGEIGEFLKCLA